MERPFAVIRSRAHVRRVSQHCFSLSTIVRLLFGFLLVLVLFPLTATPARAATQLWLPTPVGERWKIIQGYGCGTHNSWDSFALDLVNADGRTYDAPARAAADGTVFVWEAKSGTIIINHGGDFYTQYTHLAKASVSEGDTIKRGDLVGLVGDRGSPGTPHLHFHAFVANGSWARNRQTVPVSFAEGYDFPETGGCSQHQGEVVVAGEKTGMAVDTSVQLTSEAVANHWYNRDIAISFQGGGTARGWSANWDNDPTGDAPQNAEAQGAVQLAAHGEGLHTLYVRGWDANGQQTLTTFGPIGYDVTAPSNAVASEAQTIAANTASTVVRWGAATDAASGVAGYRVYLGPDANGTSEWFVNAAEASTPVLAAGMYTLRIQAVDFAGNSSEWITVGQVVAQ